MIENDGESWQEVEVLIDQIPGARFHNGGRIELGPDRKLYITTGDATERKLAQDQSSLAGKILRMDLDGTIPEDNPFNDSYVYSYGHRNPQGITWVMMARCIVLNTVIVLMMRSISLSLAKTTDGQ